MTETHALLHERRLLDGTAGQMEYVGWLASEFKLLHDHTNTFQRCIVVLVTRVERTSQRKGVKRREKRGKMMEKDRREERRMQVQGYDQTARNRRQETGSRNREAHVQASKLQKRWRSTATEKATRWSETSLGEIGG